MAFPVSYGMNENREKKLIKHISIEVAKILHDEIDIGEDVFITVVSVKLSRTLEHATVLISVLPSSLEDRVMEELSQQIYFIQQTINKRLNLRVVPKIRFEIDETEERAARIEALLDKDENLG